MNQMARARTIFVVSGLTACAALLWFGRLALSHFGRPHQPFQYASQSYYSNFAATCEMLLMRYGTNALTTMYSDPRCLVPNLSETNYTAEGGYVAQFPIQKTSIPPSIRELDPLLITVHGNELVAVTLYKPARGGFHIRWDKRPWSEHRNSLYYFWDPSTTPKTVYQK